MQFSKSPFSINDQVNLLRQRGLQILDVSKAIHHLSNINFYRLKVYSYPFQDASYPNFTFVSDTTFDQILDLYHFSVEQATCQCAETSASPTGTVASPNTV